MKVLTDEQIDTLKRFNIAVDQILDSGFVKEMAGKQTHIKITMDKIDQKTGAFEQSHEREGFDPEFTTSVLTKVRLFTDDDFPRSRAFSFCLMVPSIISSSLSNGSKLKSVNRCPAKL
jgi:hypothetical protein